MSFDATSLDGDPVEDLIRAAAGELVLERVTPMEDWQHDPVGWAVRYMGIREETLRWSVNPGYKDHAWDGTRDPIVAMAESVAGWHHTGVESGTGTGKSHTLGWLTLWFLACFPSSRVFSYAAQEEQLDLYAWTEIRKMWPRFKRLFPTAEIRRSLHLYMDGRDEVGDTAGWGAVGRAAQVRAEEDVATKAAGMHGEHMLILLEETPGIPKPIIRAVENTCTAPHNLILAVGNPDHQHDPLHELCTAPHFRHIRISALDHPNIVVNEARDPGGLARGIEERFVEDTIIVPGAASRKSVRDRADQYGVGSPMYGRRVRGISPPQAADAVIQQAWIDAAVERWLDHDRRAELAKIGGPSLGVDVANSEDGDEAAIARGPGAVLEEVSAFRCPNALHLGVKVALEMSVDGIPPRRVGVDSVGVGASTVNKLKEMGRPIRALNAGEKAHARVDRDLVVTEDVAVLEEEEFYNLRAQMWWTLRRDLQRGRIALPPDPVLHRELVVPTWETRNGRIIVEPKEKIRERLGRSPDRADAVVLWNWVRARPLPPEEEEDLHPFDPEVLEAERDYIYRVRDKRVRDDDFDPMQVSL